MSIATRLAARSARKHGTKVLYMVHGFHFFKGSSTMSWLVYYPIERIMAHFADALVTINKEDYQRGQTFAFKNVYYILCWKICNLCSTAALSEALGASAKY